MIIPEVPVRSIRGTILEVLLALLCTLVLTGAASAALGVRGYGIPARNEIALSVQPTRDGGYVMAGYADTTTNLLDAWVMKVDADGVVLWQTTLGGGNFDYFYSVQQTSDGGYVAAGATGSGAWVVKLDAGGAVVWQKTYGSGVSGPARSVRQTTDGGYIVVSTILRQTGSDVWVLKLDVAGEIVWQRSFGGTGSSLYYVGAIQQTSDGGYVVAGSTNGSGAVSYDVLLLKLDATGAVIWQKTYGSGGVDAPYSVQQTRDGGYIVGGFSYDSGTAKWSALVLKLDPAGSLVWHKSFGSDTDNEVFEVQQARDGGYVAVGFSRAGQLNSDPGRAWVTKFDAEGNVAWQRTSVGISELGAAIQLTVDGGYVVAGARKAISELDSDAWLLKLDADGLIAEGNCGQMRTTDAVVSDVGIAAREGIATTTATSEASLSTAFARYSLAWLAQRQCYVPLAACRSLITRQDEIKALPASPSAYGDFQFELTGFRGGGPITIYGAWYEISGSSITVDAKMNGIYFAVGDSYCYRMPVAGLPAGDYTVNYQVQYQSSGPDFTAPIVVDTAALTVLPTPVASAIPTLNAFALSLLAALVIVVAFLFDHRRLPR